MSHIYMLRKEINKLSFNIQKAEAVVVKLRKQHLVLTRKLASYLKQEAIYQSKIEGESDVPI